MGRVGRSQSLRAIAAALDAGITHFDVARLYGYGEAESLLGEALKGQRDKVVVASKFGLQATRAAGALRALKPIAQKLASSVPGARGVLRSLAGRPAQSADRFSVASAAASLGRSLAALRIDYLDILFLHDCAAGDLSGELLDFLDRQVAAGKIRAYGVATEFAAVAPLAAAQGDRLIYQFPSGMFAPNAERLGGGLRIVAHSPFSGAARLGSRSDAHQILLSHARAAPGVAVVLCSMLDEAHLRANLAIAERPRLRAPKRFGDVAAAMEFPTACAPVAA